MAIIASPLVSLGVTTSGKEKWEMSNLPPGAAPFFLKVWPF
jgi:hypothetical protein